MEAFNACRLIVLDKCPGRPGVRPLGLEEVAPRTIDKAMARDRAVAVARTLIGGGGGCLFIYSCSARLVSFEIKFKFINLKKN